MNLGAQIRIAIPKDLEDKKPEMVQALRDSVGEIMPVVVSNIQDRTPKRTGTLASSVTAREGDVPTLASFYAEEGPQLDEYRRVYVQYQEGPPLGISGYTNGPFQMFERVSIDDLSAIDAWARAVIAREVAKLEREQEITELGGEL